MQLKLSDAQRRAVRARGLEIFCRLDEVICRLPRGFDVLREMALLLHGEFVRGRENDLLCDMGYLVLQLARPAVADENPETADRMDALFAKIDAGDDIPY